MKTILFGPAGAPLSTPQRSTRAGVARVAELELGCMEVEFVQGVKMGEETARSIGVAADAMGVALSAHGPYAINLNSREREKVDASKQRIIKTARVAAQFGGKSIVFHPGFLFDNPPSVVMKRVKEALSDVVAALKAENNRVWIRPEVAGKVSQFGSLDEVIELSAELDGVMPCIDFAHWHARTGKFNTYGEFVAMLRRVESGLGRRALDDLHMHISGIEYSSRGETRHLELRESDFNYLDLVRALKDERVSGLAICESPNREVDARFLQDAYNSM